ncbi:hypothetical protein BDQ17DRAFT_830766 [Cyathus striatus]|nr:hypothetical protein BDQ17DRAFT_830766 [Cyathus striatus]
MRVLSASGFGIVPLIWLTALELGMNTWACILTNIMAFRDINFYPPFLLLQFVLDPIVNLVSGCKRTHSFYFIGYQCQNGRLVLQCCSTFKSLVSSSSLLFSFSRRN